jgi:serine/threonine protein phosphatase 1
MKVFVIGDIHGGLRGLEQVLERARVTAQDKIIFLGDYVDGWSESAQVIDFLLQLEMRCQVLFIKGNHDVYCLNWLRGGEVDPTWLRHGGLATIKSYENIDPEKKLRHIQFFERLLNYYIDDQNNLFIHAGFTSMHGPEKEVHDSMYNWDRTLWEMALCMDKRIEKESSLFPKRLLLFNEIYIGHTPTLNYDVDVPMQGCNVWNVDTGAAFKGKLSIMNISSKEYFQSDILPALYPNENGRN